MRKHPTPEAPHSRALSVTSPSRNFSQIHSFPLASAYLHLSQPHLLEGMDVTDLPIKYDQKFADRVCRMSWQRSHHGYARHCWSENGRIRWVSMHRLVWAWEYGWENVPRYIDHIDGDRMNNRLENLRATTLSLNAHNARRKVRDLPQGVFVNKGSAVSPYYSMISHRTRLYHLGVFSTVEEAQEAYSEARRRVMEYEAAVAVGESPEPPEIVVKRSRRGRPPMGGGDEALSLYRSGLTVRQVAERMGINERTVSRLLKSVGVSLKRGKRSVDRNPPAGMMDARSVSPQESRDDYGNNHRERGQGTGTSDVEVREADGELLGRLDGEEGRRDDVGGCGLL